MWYFKTTIYFCCLISLCTTNSTNKNNLFKKEVYCGKKLTNILVRFCIEFPTHHTGAVLVHRRKRQIVQECCKKRCSLDYLLDNYCQKINETALDAFINIDNNYTNDQKDFPTSSTTALQPTIRFHMKDIEYSTPESTFYDRRKHRRKRNCKCKPNGNRIHNKKRRLTLESEIGEVEIRQTPFYVQVF